MMFTVFRGAASTAPSALRHCAGSVPRLSPMWGLEEAFQSAGDVRDIRNALTTRSKAAPERPASSVTMREFAKEDGSAERITAPR